MLFMYNFTDVVPVKNYIMLNQSLIIGCCFNSYCSQFCIYIFYFVMLVVKYFFSSPRVFYNETLFIQFLFYAIWYAGTTKP